jgi:hypothetical protein
MPAVLYSDYAVDSVGTGAYAIAPTPAIAAYVAGQVFLFKAGTANTGTCSLNVSGLGAKTIKKDVSVDLATGDILANQDVMVVYDGTNMQLISQTSSVAANIQNSNYVYAADSVGTDSYAITVTPAPTAYATGQRFIFKAGTVNTGAATLNVNALGAKSIVKSFNVALDNGDIKASQIVEVVYDGTNFQMVSALATTVSHKTGQSTRTADTASGSQTIAHGLGKTPRKVTISSSLLIATNCWAMSIGNYDGTSTNCIFIGSPTNVTGANASGDTTNIVYMYRADGTAGSQAATIAVDATNITLTWTKTGTMPANTIYLSWEVEG